MKKLTATVLASLMVFGTVPSALAADGTPLRIPITSEVTLLISSAAKCDSVKPGAYYACEITAKAEAPWFGGGEHPVYSDTGEKIGFLSVFSDPNADGTRKARISLNKLPASMKIKIANDANIISITAPEVLAVKQFDFKAYKFPSSVKSYTAVRLYATDLWGNPTPKNSLMIGVPKTVQLAKKSSCSTIKVPVAFLDENGEAVTPRSYYTAKFLEFKLSAWKGSSQVTSLEYGQGKTPWASGQITTFDMKFCGINTKSKSKTSFSVEAWAAFHYFDDSSLTETASVTFIQK